MRRSLFNHFFFPSFCLHCQVKQPFYYPLCASCLQLVEILPQESSSQLITFDAPSPISSLISLLKKGKAPFLAAGIAAYMGLQYLRSDLPPPDWIVPVPQSLMRALQVGYNPSRLLANMLAPLLGAPVALLLKRRRQWFRQTKLDRERRYRLSVEQFAWNSHYSIAGKVLLLVDDLIGTGSTLRCCERRLLEGLPLRVIQMAAIADSSFKPA